MEKALGRGPGGAGADLASPLNSRRGNGSAQRGRRRCFPARRPVFNDSRMSFSAASARPAREGRADSAFSVDVRARREPARSSFSARRPAICGSGKVITSY